jgi:TetR/AcrR family transcriptional repressor of nem operon
VGGIYRHFSSKEELAAEAFEYAWKAALDARMHDLDEIPNSVDKLKQFVANFVRRRSSVPGGCPLLNTAIDADDGNPVLRECALKGLRAWRDRLCAVASTGIKRREIRRGINARKLATLIISSLEGALMIARLKRGPEALTAAQAHLDHYLEVQVRVGLHGLGLVIGSEYNPKTHGERDRLQPARTRIHGSAIRSQREHQARAGILRAGASFGRATGW